MIKTTKIKGPSGGRNSLLRSTIIAGAMAFGAVTPLLLSTNAYAQDYTTGGIEGIIYNTAGEVVPGAVVTATSRARGTTTVSTTNAEGRYRLPRLQIGAYDLVITSDLYNTGNESVSVTVGSIQSRSYVLTGGGADEIITTAVQQKAYDFEVAGTGLVIDVTETFERTPLPRSLAALTLLTPGTVEGDSAFQTQGGNSLASLSGASIAENTYYVNGMAITDIRNFVGGSSVPFEFYQQVETKTGGFPAEFGRATGGVSNAVTKSGSNEYHFGANLYVEPDGLGTNSPDTLFSVNNLDERENIESNFYVSGPIIKDKLFGYFMVSPRKRTSSNTFRDYSSTIATDAAGNEIRDANGYATDVVLTPNTTGSRIERSNDDPFFGAKIDFNITDNHTLEGTWFRDAATIVDRNFNLDFANGTEQEVATLETQSGGDVFIGKYTGRLSDWLTVSALYGKQTFDKTISQTGDDCPIITDSRQISTRTDGGALGSESDRINSCESTTAPLQADDEDSREQIRLDADVYFSALGEHHVRVGYDSEKLASSTVQQYPGGAAYLLFTSSNAIYQGVDEIARVRARTLDGAYEIDQDAFYIQDSWDVSDRLTLNLGLRNDSFTNLNPLGETYVELKNQWAPRLAFAYDLFGDGHTTVSGAWGRYFIGIPSNTNMRQAGNERDGYEYYELISTNGSATPTIGTTLLRSVPLADGSITDPSGIVNEYLEPMYSDEIILGLRHDFDNGWDFGVNFTHRELASTIEDVAIDAGVIGWCAQNGITGCENVWTGFHQYVVTNPGSDMRVNLNIDSAAGAVLGANGTDPFFADLSADLLGYPKAERTYEAIEFTFNREFSDKFDLHGSYTFSNLEGNYEGSVKSDNGQDDTGITTDYDQPGLTDGAYGKSPNHRAHKLKMWGAYELTDDFLIGASYRLTSPRKLGCMGEHPTDQFAAAYGSVSHFCGGKLVPRGSALTTDWVSRLDLSFSYDASKLIESSFPGKLKVRADIFNVFNSKASTDLREYGEFGAGDGDPLSIVPEGRYGTPTSFQTPRYVRFGISYDY